MKNKGNNSNTLLATALIFALWLMWFATIGLLAELCNGNYFWWRAIGMYPFTLVNFKASKIIWNHYR
jgi:hypothetical protein